MWIQGISASMKSSAERKRDYHYRIGDISPVPKVVAPKRRAKCKNNLALFQRTYLSHLCFNPFSKDQKEVIKGLEVAIKKTGKSAKALPRGGGKTTIGIGACLWALLYGWRHFVVVIGPEAEHAKSIIEDVQAELEGNELLLADFPEVCYAIQQLEGRAARARSQHEDGKLTKIKWTTDRIRFPIIKGSKVAGSILRSTGITSSIRGMKSGARRPDFVLLDDPQTRESAESTKQTEARENIINGDILGLAGHNKTISVYMTCTVIAKDDLSDRFLDRTTRPQWHGKRAKLVYAWPENKLWDKYNKIWKEDQEAGDSEAKNATAFYKKNRKKMDKGVKVADKHAFDSDVELSAIQHARNLLLDVGVAAFEAEYQNQPLAREFALYDIDAKMVRSRCNGLARLKIDESVRIVVSFCDINYSGLHWTLIGFRNDRTGFILDYGKIPEGNKVLIPANSNETEQKKLIYKGLNKYIQQLNGLNLKVPIRAACIDRGFKPETVHNFCKWTSARFAIYPAKGFGGTQYRPGKHAVGEPGIECHISDSQYGQFFAANSCYFREIGQRGFLSKPGQSGSLSFFGKDPVRHTDISEHICAETLTDKAEGRNGLFWKWSLRPGAINDWLDAITGCFAIATWFLGEVISESTSGGRGKTVKKRKKKAERRKPSIQIER